MDTCTDTCASINYFPKLYMNKTIWQKTRACKFSVTDKFIM